MLQISFCLVFCCFGRRPKYHRTDRSKFRSAWSSDVLVADQNIIEPSKANFVLLGLRNLLFLFIDVTIPPSIHVSKGEKIMLIDSPMGQYIELTSGKLISLKSTEIFKF